MKFNIDQLFQIDEVKAKNALEYLLYAAIIFGVLMLFYFLFNIYLKKLEGKGKYPYVSKLRKSLRAPVFLLALFISLIVPLQVVELPDKINSPLQIILKLILIGLSAWTAIRAISLTKHLVLRKYDITGKDNLKARKVYTQFRVMERILIFIIVIVALSLGLMTFESIRKFGVSLIASAGIAGIILGFAAQKALGTVLAGFQIAITQPIRLEDVVIVENEWGWIEEINLTYVVVRIWDQRRLVLPTNYFIEKPFQNWTRTSAEILGTVFIHTDYNVPFDALREELTRLLEASELWDRRVNVLQVTDAKERTVEIRALMSAVDSPTAWDLRVYVREGLISFLQKNYPESLPRTRVVMEDNLASKPDRMLENNP
ncbi:mechanosensitive ion channel [Flammeovirgaceae bacterium SG7u.111]|nr:mechanosensitive ion channel [Flammeovirgaceae bacterium SG7u.132]WPO33002.1 mechanosensitive ion channel [Flammeovirgaceae bacterium SG7u.111]